MNDGGGGKAMPQNDVSISETGCCEAALEKPQDTDASES